MKKKGLIAGLAVAALGAAALVKGAFMLFKKDEASECLEAEYEVVNEEESVSDSTDEVE